MSKLKKRYDINQCSLYKCKSKNKLIKLLNINDEIYKDIESIIKYNTFSIPKKNSVDERIITAPCKLLKNVQRRLLRLIQYIKRPDWLISGEKGKCYIDNARKHVNSNYFLTLDIKQFYDNCKREYVYNFFSNRLLMANDLAKICTDIVTYKGGIPTGCPTSQLIAFYAYEKMFSKIYDITRLNNCVYTLYVDDITISSISPVGWGKIIRDIDCILRSYGHSLKSRKIKYYKLGDSAHITGVNINNHTLKTPNKIQKSIYYEYIKLLKQSKTNKQSVDQQVIKHIKGELIVARNIEPGKFSEINSFIKSIS